MTSLEAQSFPRQRTLEADDDSDDELLDLSTENVPFEVGDPEHTMSTQASLDDGSDGTLPPKNEAAQNNLSGHSTVQAGPIQKRATSVGQQVSDETDVSNF